MVATAIHTGHDLRPEIAELMVLVEDDRFCEDDPFTDALEYSSGMQVWRDQNCSSRSSAVR